MPYLNKIDFVIGEAYTLTDEDNALLKKAKGENCTWSDAEYLPFKQRIRTHLKPLQNGRCAFCRLRIPTSLFYPHLEHIVSKKARDAFEFLPVNLVWCCQRCNFDKGQSVTLVDPNTVNYPVNSAGFNIVNPYYDKFSDHFDLLDNLIIVKKMDSTKAANTYKYYKLDRIELVEDRAYELKTERNESTPDAIAGILSIRLTKENDPKLLEQIQTILGNIQNWQID